MNVDGRIVELLSRIADDVGVMRAIAERGRASAAPSAADVELWHAIAATTAGRVSFTTGELLLHAEFVAGRSHDPRLRDAIVGAVGALNGLRLGKRLAKLEGDNVAGLVITRAGEPSRDGIAWKIAVLRD